MQPLPDRGQGATLLSRAVSQFLPLYTKKVCGPLGDLVIGWLRAVGRGSRVEAARDELPDGLDVAGRHMGVVAAVHINGVIANDKVVVGAVGSVNRDAEIVHVASHGGVDDAPVVDVRLHVRRTRCTGDAETRRAVDSRVDIEVLVRDLVVATKVGLVTACNEQTRATKSHTQRSGFAKENKLHRRNYGNDAFDAPHHRTARSGCCSNRHYRRHYPASLRSHSFP